MPPNKSSGSAEACAAAAGGAGEALAILAALPPKPLSAKSASISSDWAAALLAADFAAGCPVALERLLPEADLAGPLQKPRGVR